MRRNNVFRRKYKAASAAALQQKIAVVKANAAVAVTASTAKSVADGMPPDLTDALATVNQRLDDAAIP